MWHEDGESRELLVNLKRPGELFYMPQLQFMMFKRATGEKTRHPEFVLARKLWMQQYMKSQDL
eukprot:6157335-Prorocentrum_lima.AAC.1